MGKDNDWIGALGILAGIVLGLGLLGKALSKNKVEYFRCWSCNRVITKNQNICPYCGANNDFGGEGYA
ncbi:MAG: zinc-ribbon domain-containing protein [Thaumarchaeota archaeon]|nr:zinc-ribbon domain-containing protein [Nitrososphaerota archaeon]